MRLRFFIAIAASTALVAISFVQPTQGAKLPERMAGVYKFEFENMDLSDGKRYRSEDILEIVPYKAKTAYFRIVLKTNNGHGCDLSGIANASPDRLIYNGPNDRDGMPCVLTIRRARGGIQIYEEKSGACRNLSCSARGMYDMQPNVSLHFRLTDRRPIHYLPRLFASSEYATAVKEYDARTE